MVARGRVRQKKSARADMESAPTAYGSASSMTRGSFRRHKVPAGSPLQSIFGEVLLCFLLFFAQQHTVGFPAQHQQDLQLVRAQLQTGPPKQLQQPLGIPLLCQAGILLRQLQQPLLKLTVRIECQLKQTASSNSSGARFSLLFQNHFILIPLFCAGRLYHDKRNTQNKRLFFVKQRFFCVKYLWQHRTIPA